MIIPAHHSQIPLLRNVFHKIFQSTNPFGSVIQDQLPERLIICPVEGYHFSQMQYEAIFNAMREISEDVFYITHTESAPDPFATNEHWIGTLPSRYSDYLDTSIFLENAIYSAQGTWGVIISHEDHAVIGGTKEYMDVFKRHYPHWDTGLKEFVKLWEQNKVQYNSQTMWMDDLLRHVSNNK